MTPYLKVVNSVQDFPLMSFIWLYRILERIPYLYFNITSDLFLTCLLPQNQWLYCQKHDLFLAKLEIGLYFLVHCRTVGESMCDWRVDLLSQNEMKKKF